MSSDKQAIDMFKARHEPSLVFDSPSALANDDRLSNPQKLELLELWEGAAKRDHEYDRSQGDEAKPDILREISDAIDSLER